MDTVECRELIVTTLTRRGKGTPHSPIRVITEIFEKGGTKLAEHDPIPDTFTLLDLVHFATYCIEEDIPTNHVTVTTIEKWLDSIKNKE